MGRTVELRVAGQSYRVVSSAPEEELRRLAAMVSAKVAELGPRARSSPQQSMLLAAIALAHDAEARRREIESERDQRRSMERRARDLLRRVLSRVEQTLESLEPREAEGTER